MTWLQILSKLEGGFWRESPLRKFLKDPYFAHQKKNYGYEEQVREEAAEEVNEEATSIPE